MPPLPLLMVLLVFILGISLGSFQSVILHRVRAKTPGMFFGRSLCPHCKHPLKSGDLMPLLSFLLLRGKCRYCEKKINISYFLLEAAMGLQAVLWYLRFPFLGETVFDWHAAGLFGLYLLVSFFFIGIFVYDLLYLEIPDILLFPAIGLSLLGGLLLLQHPVLDLLLAALIALAFFGSQYLFSKGNWLGEGDIYLALAMAFLFGWKLFIVAIVLTYFIGSAISLLLLSLKKVQGKSKVPFAPFMVGGTFATLLFGQQLLAWYSQLIAL